MFIILFFIAVYIGRKRYLKKQSMDCFDFIPKETLDIWNESIDAMRIAANNSYPTMEEASKRFQDFPDAYRKHLKE